jgi:hypothetical protein
MVEREGGGKPIRGSILNYFLRHFIASIISILTPILLVIVGYFILLLLPQLPIRILVAYLPCRFG